jgi:hypothetical protein
MPLITNNSSLGDLFGGKIATMNFSYEPNSSPSSATITIVSENNRYIEPELYSRIVLPILGIPMRIVEVQYNDDGDSKTLQVEMLDELSFTLDKRLILINGVHSTGLKQNKETQQSYPYIEYLGHPKANWRDNGPTNERIKRTQYGVLLGSNRTTITINKPYSNFTPTITNPSISLVYDAQKRNVEAGTANVTVYNQYEIDLPTVVEPDQFAHTNEWGYTLSDFSAALSSLGIRISGLPTTNANAYFFNNTGTIRSVLSSILSTFGLSFYVDPLSSQIFVINNRTIDTMNRNLALLYNANIQNLQTNTGVTKGTFKKTLKNTTARRMVLDTSFVEPESEPINNTPTPKSKQFHRIKFDRLKKGWDDKEFEFLKKVAGIYLTDIDRSIIDLYIYALAKSYNPRQWTSKPDDLKTYGGTLADGSSMIDQTEVSLYNKDPQSNNNSVPFWQQAIRQSAVNIDNPSRILPGFDYRSLKGALPNTKTVKEEGGVLRSNVFAADPPDRLEEFAMAMNWIGFGDYHITSPMSGRRTERYSFIDQSPYKVIGPYPSLTKISEIAELGHINYLAIRSGKGEEELTVGDLFDMRRTEEEGGPLDEFGFTRNDLSTPTMKNKSKSFHFIAYLDLDLYKNIFDFDAGKLLKENFYLFNIVDAASSANAEQWLLVTDQWATLMERITNTCEDLYRYWYIGEGKIKVTDKDKYVRDTSNKRTFKYTISDDGQGGGGEGKEINIENKGIFTKNSNLPDNLFLNIEVDSLSLANLTSEKAAEQLSTEQVGPFYEINLNYYRPPKRSDFEILKGLKSISSSIGPEGITTDISYSSRLYQEINRSFLFKYSDKSVNSGPISNNKPSFAKNLGIG